MGMTFHVNGNERVKRMNDDFPALLRRATCYRVRLLPLRGEVNGRPGGIVETVGRLLIGDLEFFIIFLNTMSS